MQQPSGVAVEQARAETGIHVAIAQLIQAVRADLDVHPGAIWTLMTAAALKLPAVDYAGIMLVEQDDSIRTLSSTDAHLRLLDHVQQRHREGSGLEPACEQQARRVDDLTGESRWPTFRDEAVTMTPIRSILSVPLFPHHHCRTALNLYADRPSAFGAEGELMGLAFASDAQAVIEIGRRERRYRKAITNRDLIGQAKGILMERFAIDPVTAFSLLAQLSKDRRQPVSAVARTLVSKRSEA
ncbi:GAF and ANTAR domain-containing protein [Mycolicibacterium sp. 120270]|uniref:GAF and ANTAR domain-containing protein n=1 Tax=Mycolicibacterium sp. 120270 TaxID=3090600 RepID=UPI00299EFB77|nr:GAF and ANTAR domain-containing protein [Mycolicibacterium sp. 120270]MDX1885740.1 GAF and ANTAR domain-containing protein [Mycolicibacterium sp. 120270]